MYHIAIVFPYRAWREPIRRVEALQEVLDINGGDFCYNLEDGYSVLYETDDKVGAYAFRDLVKEMGLEVEIKKF